MIGVLVETRIVITVAVVIMIIITMTTEGTAMMTEETGAEAGTAITIVTAAETEIVTETTIATAAETEIKG